MTVSFLEILIKLNYVLLNIFIHNGISLYSGRRCASSQAIVLLGNYAILISHPNAAYLYFGNDRDILALLLLSSQTQRVAAQFILTPFSVCFQ
jgi:hypothetical protein